jgi:selenoprotein W-related protein
MAASISDKYKDKLEGEIDLSPSSGGAFEISVDGKMAYSKLKTGRFPDEKELLEAIGKTA